jgi:hypothetical protein
MGKRIFKGKTYDCPAIVTEKTFNLVKEKLATRDQFKNTTNRYTFLVKASSEVIRGKMVEIMRMDVIQRDMSFAETGALALII